MKRFFPLFLAVCLTAALLLGGCSKSSGKLAIDDTLDATEEALTAAMADGGGFSAFAACVCDWAEHNHIDVKASKDTYLVLSSKSTVGYEHAPSFTFHAGITTDDEDELEDSLETASIAMTAIYSAQTHGTLSVIFTAEEKGKPVGAAALKKKYLQTDNLIDLDRRGDSAVINCIAASSDMTATKALTTVKPEYTQGYEIAFQGTPYRSPYGNHRGDYPNGIKMIGDLLASCQSSSVLFELASFSGGEDIAMYPASAQAVVVLQENDVERFTSRFERSYERVAEYYEDLEEPFSYTIRPVKRPVRVFSAEDTENIVSFMYTLTNGIYSRTDSGSINAVSNIGLVSTRDGRFSVQINAKSLQNTLMEEMRNIFATTCGLCDMKFRQVSATDLWYRPDHTPLVETLCDILRTECTDVLEDISLTALLEKKPDLNAVIWGTKPKHAADDLPALLTYIQSQRAPAGDTE